MLEKRICSYLKSRLLAFTLAEVLIVVGVIGIVAALTIPTLINKVQKMEMLSALTKFYSTQDDAWAKVLVSYGVEDLQYTGIFQDMSDTECSTSDLTTTTCKNFVNELRNGFKFGVITSGHYPIYYIDGSAYADKSNISMFKFYDGSLLFDGTFNRRSTSEGHDEEIKKNGGHMFANQGSFFVDVNGFKNPNRIGRDIYQFYLGGNGKIYPAHSSETSLFFYGNLNSSWKTDKSYCGTTNSKDLTGVTGIGCGARIIDESWQMIY